MEPDTDIEKVEKRPSTFPLFSKSLIVRSSLNFRKNLMKFLTSTTNKEESSKILHKLLKKGLISKITMPRVFLVLVHT